jgi:hypothetical protein
MPNMHRTGRVGGDVFDVDLLAATDVGMPVIRASLQDCLRLRRPEGFGEPKVDEARSRDLDARDVRVRLQPDGELHCQLARLAPKRLRQKHRGIGGDIAMRSIARRLGCDPLQHRCGGNHPISADNGFHRGSDPLLEQGEEVHRGSCSRLAAPPLSGQKSPRSGAP